MVADRDSDPDAHLYADLVSGSGEKAAQALLARIQRFICKKHPEFCADAEVIALEAFERVCEKLNTFAWKSRFSSWVIGVACNVLKEHTRAKGREPLSEECLPELLDEYSDPEKRVLDQFTSELNQLLIEEALTSLTERQRDVFLLKYKTEAKITSEQIGEKLGISAGAARSALADAHAAIERWRRKNGY